MRKFLLFAALAALLAVPAVGSATRAAPKDGTLSIKNGVGMVFVHANGAIIGRMDKGKITIVDLAESDGTEPIVRGCDSGEKTNSGDDNIRVCSGKNIRFRVIGGRYRLRILKGVGIDLSAVGRSASKDPKEGVELNGAGITDIDGDGTLVGDGTFAFDDDAPKSLPDKATYFQLGSS